MTAVVLTCQISTRKTIENASFPTVARRSTTTVTSQNTVLTAGIRAITLHCLAAPCRIAIGNGVQTANASTGIYLSAGQISTFTTPLVGPANIAVIRDTAAATDGVLEITELRA